MSVMNIPRFFFFIMVHSSPSHSQNRSNQSLASIHWLTYKPNVVVAVVFMSSVVGVCIMYCRCFQPVRQAACGLLSVTACVERCVNNIWSAPLSRFTLAYSSPTACPNKALNRLERLQRRREFQSEQKSHTISGTILFSKQLIYISSPFLFINN